MQVRAEFLYLTELVVPMAHELRITRHYTEENEVHLRARERRCRIEQTRDQIAEDDIKRSPNKDHSK